MARRRTGAARVGRKAARTAGRATAAAQDQLKRLRQGTLVAVALTGLLLLLVPEVAPAQEEPSPASAEGATLPLSDTLGAASPLGVLQTAPDTSAPSLRPDRLADETATQARGVLAGMWNGLVRSLPKLLVAALLLTLAWGLLRLLRPLVVRLSAHFERGAAISALLGTVVWVIAAGAALSVLAGDIRALVGSLGLVGLALSWSLQGPIESFTGWLINSFKGYYREGDRIAVGGVTGDVYRIDVLNTTVWEIGGPGSTSGVQAEQPTGRLITFPNSEVVAGIVVNYSRDFAFVWDELAVSVAPESDLGYAVQLVQGVANALLAEGMREPAREYGERLAEMGLDGALAEGPEVFVHVTDWSVDLVVRYLVNVRQRRRVKSALAQALLKELGEEEHAVRVPGAYPRQQVQFINEAGRVATPPSAE